MRAVRDGEIRVIVRFAWLRKKSRKWVRGYFNRPFVGITVAEALKRLDGRDREHLRDEVSHAIMEPYYLNGKRVEENSTEVIKAGDVLDVDDP